MEDENFSLVVQMRANYYTPGSPVQFVRVELLRGDESKQNAVCLTFKNISPNRLSRLEIRFRCKGADGTVLCEDSFHYEGLEADAGELFGMDDAVFVTEQQIASVDVILMQAVYGRKTEDLQNCRRVRLPAPKKLAPDMAVKLQARIGRDGLEYTPQVLENGWYCACGAFHPNEEDTVYCSECGSDRILLQNALSSLLQPDSAASAAPAAGESPTRVVSPAAPPARETTRSYEPEEGSTREVVREAEPVRSAPRRAPAAEDEETARRDAVAENLIRWVPPAAALLCAAIALGGFCYCQLFLR